MLVRFFWHWQPWSYEQILKDFYSISHNLAVFLRRLEALKSDSMNNNVEIHLPVAKYHNTSSIYMEWMGMETQVLRVQLKLQMTSSELHTLQCN